MLSGEFRYPLNWDGCVRCATEVSDTTIEANQPKIFGIHDDFTTAIQPITGWLYRRR